MKNTTIRIIRTIVLTLIVIIVIFFITSPYLIGKIIYGQSIRNEIKCMNQMSRITDGLKEYFGEHKQYPPKLQDIYNYIIKHHEYVPEGYRMVCFRCPASKVRNKDTDDTDYDYFVDSSNNIVIYEKENYHYIHIGGGCGFKPYNARHVLIFDGKNKDIKLYSDDDFKILLDKHQHKPDKENK